MRKLKNNKVKEEKVEEKVEDKKAGISPTQLKTLDYIFYALFAVTAFLSENQIVLVRTMGLIFLVVVILHFIIGKIISRSFVYRMLGFLVITILTLGLHKVIDLFA